MQEQLDIALRIAREAGDILLEAQHHGIYLEQVEHKGVIDLVTPSDRRSEAHIRARLAEYFPQDAVLAEEGGQTGTAARVWCVDPLDGTTNFAHGFPFFCVSIALLVNGEPQLGVVHAPVLGWTFSCIAGYSACLNGKEMPHLDRRDDLSQALLMFGCGYDRTVRPQRYLGMIHAFMVRTQGLRRTGSAALDCCLCARGQVDGYIEVNLHPWDLAAGALIARNTGAIVTDIDGKPFDLFSGRILLGRPGIHDAMLAVMTTPEIIGPTTLVDMMR